jgi:hypothetical protein
MGESVKVKRSRCDGCMDVGVINCMGCIAGDERVSSGTTGSGGGCRNAEMSSRIAALKVRVENIEILAGRPLVGPTEWAEAVSLARHAVDRVGVEVGAVKPDYILGTVGRDIAGILASLVRELSAQGIAPWCACGDEPGSPSAAMTDRMIEALSAASTALKGLEALHVL